MYSIDYLTNHSDVILRSITSLFNLIGPNWAQKSLLIGGDQSDGCEVTVLTNKLALTRRTEIAVNAGEGCMPVLTNVHLFPLSCLIHAVQV